MGYWRVECFARGSIWEQNTHTKGTEVTKVLEINKLGRGVSPWRLILTQNPKLKTQDSKPKVSRTEITERFGIGDQSLDGRASP